MEQRRTKRDSVGDGGELRRLQQEFEADFSKPKDHTTATWIRGEVVQKGKNPGSTMHSATMGMTAGSTYQPGVNQQQQTLKTISPAHNAFNAAKARAEELDAKFNARSSLKPKPKTQAKKKSNLELFKEEIKAKHDATEAMRAEAKKKAELTGQTGSFNNPLIPNAVSDQGDPNSTNIFIASISPNLAEKDLEDKFGPFGPLTSIKIMYPRTEDEKMRNRNCAFVAFCCRKDAERCMSQLQNQQWFGHELKLGWGKAIPNILQQPPIYMPERLKWFLAPPPPSKLPLNAQPPGEIPGEHEKYSVDQINKCTVRVVIPTDQQLVRLINRVVEFVIKEGPMFEAILMDRESNNPMFQFLFDYSCPAHSYYRWRLFSVLQGESLDQWSTSKFVMYRGGPKWRPPILNFKIHGMPVSDDEENDDFGMLRRFHQKKERKTSGFTPIGQGMKSQFGSINPAEKELEQWADKTEEKKLPFKPVQEPPKETNGQDMPRAQREEFESSLRTLVPIRELVGDLMALCLEQSDHAQEIVLEIKDAIVNQECLLNQRLARIYLMSDILFNSTAVPKGSKYRALFAEHQLEIFEKLNQIHTAIQSRFVAEQFKTRVMTLLRAWTDWSVYASDLLIKLNNTFLGIHPGSDTDDDLDGEPINESDDEVDGKPMSEEDDDVDGKPIEIEPPKAPAPISGIGTGFVKSKWEVIDEEDIKAEAVTSAEIFAETKRKDAERVEREHEEDKKEKKEAKPMYLQSDAWRKRMRAIEVNVIEYCEQLRVKEESPQAEAYRSTLIKQATNEFMRNTSLWEDDNHDSPSRRSPPSKKEKKSKKSRSERYDYDDYERSRKRSRSPHSRSDHHRHRSRDRSRSRSRDRDRSRSSRRHRR